MDGALGFSIAVLTIFFLISGIYGLEYPVSKKFKRAKISGGSATILTDPIFEIFQNLADVIHGDYLIVKAEYDHLNEELEFYISQANENKDASDRGFTVREYSAKMVENLRELKNEVIGKHLSYIEKMGHNFRSLLMMFTPVGKFEQSYKVYRKILSFWITKLWTFLGGLVGHKLSVTLIFVALFYL